jgi:hypothetical protein
MKKLALLTGTINPRKFNTPKTKLMDEKVRLKQYVETIEKYILNSNFEIIIFCENSNYKYDYKNLMNLARKNKKNLEIVRFLGNKKEVLNKGKGYGEGEIIDYALENSKYLKKPNQTFYKITGRIFIKNINKILKKSCEQNYFFSVGKDHCVTLFFKCSVEFYKKNLIGAGRLCNELKGTYLEEIFFHKLIGISSEISRIYEYPIYDGMSGTNAIQYKNGLKWFIRNLQLKLGFLDIK